MVGFDPGMSSGLAVLSVDGKLLLSKTYTGSRGIAIDVISVGRPIVVATDVPKVPKAVKRLASAFGCPVFKPARYYTSFEKSELLKKSGWQGLEIHEADALFAAQLCLNATQKKIGEILESKLSSEEQIKALSLLLSGENVSEAVRRATLGPLVFAREPGRIKRSGSSVNRDKIDGLESLVNKLKDENDALRKEIRDLEESEHALRDQRNALLFKDRRFEVMRHRIDTLERLLAERQGDIDRLKRELARLAELLRSVAEGTEVAVPKINALPDNAAGVRLTSSKVVMIDGSLGDEELELLKRNGVEYVFVANADHKIIEKAAEKGLYPITDKDISFVDVGNVVIFDAKALKESQVRSMKIWNMREIEKKRKMLKELLGSGKRLALIPSKEIRRVGSKRRRWETVSCAR
ncbi:MAG: DUF460 domain-containing protein [Thermoprotei archaeon]